MGPYSVFILAMLTISIIFPPWERDSGVPIGAAAAGQLEMVARPEYGANNPSASQTK